MTSCKDATSFQGNINPESDLSLWSIRLSQGFKCSLAVPLLRINHRGIGHRSRWPRPLSRKLFHCIQRNDKLKNYNAVILLVLSELKRLIIELYPRSPNNLAALGLIILFKRSREGALRHSFHFRLQRRFLEIRGNIGNESMCDREFSFHHWWLWLDLI